MYRFGLKLWSTNDNYVKEAIRLYEKKFYYYIELYVVPSSSDFINVWKELSIPFVIHAPHYNSGMNLANKDNFKKNMILADESLKYADALKADKIIFHPGVEGNIEETIKQLLIINDSRIIIENKPYYSLDGTMVCVGYSYEEISSAMQKTGYGFCLDCGHAIAAANAFKNDALEYIKKFMNLKPCMFHLTDGTFNNLYDKHDRYGKGDFPLTKILQLIPDNSFITNEASKASKDNLDDFEDDMEFIKGIIVNNRGLI